MNFACGVVLSQKILPAAPFFTYKILSHWIWFQWLLYFSNSLVLKMIRIQLLSNHSDTICWKQRWRKCQITIFLSDHTSWDTSHTTPNHFQNSIFKTTYVITRNRNITTTRVVFIRLHFHAVSSRLLLGPWHSNNPEPKIHLFLLESEPYFCLAYCPWWLPTSSTHHISPTITCAQSVAQCLCNITFENEMSLRAPPTSHYSFEWRCWPTISKYVR